jgi:hypothetical protein
MDLEKQVKIVNPTPELGLQKKFHYFYSGHNYVANTHRYMTFDDAHDDD